MTDIKPLVEQPDSWIDTAPLRVHAERTVGASTAAVWELVADHERWPSWFNNVKKVEVTGAADAVGGTRRVWVGPVVIEERFTRWEPGECFAFSVTGMSRRLVKSLNERVSLTALDEGTRITYEQAFDPTAVSGLVLKTIKGRVSAQLSAALDALGAQAAEKS
jgi:uncharacterized protein YndB with AHSA1/START domain